LLSNKENIHEIDSPLPGFRIVAFQKALESCELSPSEVARSLESLLSSRSSLWRTFNETTLISPSTPKRRAPIVIAIDSFGRGRHSFASFAIPDFPEQGEFYIALDCHPISRDYWRHSLAHELTHALNWGRGIPSWADEMAAQMVEVNSGGHLPFQSLGRLANAAQLPRFSDESRPLSEAQTYGLVYLFGEYLRSIGGWELIQAFLGYRTRTECESNSFLGSATCRAQAWLKSRDGQWDFAEKMTPQGLLRHFAAAVTLNHPAYRYYRIPLWSGFLSPPERLEKTLRLAPGDFRRFDAKDFDRRFVPGDYEVYLLRKGLSAFSLTPVDSSGRVINDKTDIWSGGPSEDFYLVINTTGLR
jgi:hypothetical protein